MREQITYIKTSNNTTEVTLNLPGKTYKGRGRRIGTIYHDKRTFFTVRDRSKHVFRVNNGLGINYEVLKDPNGYFDNVVINLSGEIIRTTKEFFIHNGMFMHFGKNKLEKQVILPIDKFGLELAEKWASENVKAITVEIKEKPAETQISLFEERKAV
jgi:hypothetical protein